MPSRVIRTPEQFDALGRLLAALERPFTVDWRKGADRTQEQNKLMWRWAGEVAAQMGDRTAGEVQAEWKLRHGVPILRAENADFRAFYDASLIRLTYEQKIAAMEFVPVTRDMTVPQMTQFIETVQREAANNGVLLSSGEDAK